MKKYLVLLVFVSYLTGCQYFGVATGAASGATAVVKKANKDKDMPKCKKVKGHLEYTDTENYWIEYLIKVYPNWKPTPKIKKINNHNFKVKSNSFIGNKYIVQGNETLFDIALAFYGDGSKWTVISEANKDLLKSIKQLTPGTELTIPKL